MVEAIKIGAYYLASLKAPFAGLPMSRSRSFFGPARQSASNLLAFIWGNLLSVRTSLLEMERVNFLKIVDLH